MDICEAVSSIQNKNKINVRGYLMVKDKKRNNSYYWYCEKRDQLRCNGRATTMFTEDQHHLPVQIIQSVLAGSSQEIGSHLPSRDALRQAVKRVRRANLPAEPQSFANLIIPDNLQKTLSNSEFLIRDLNIDPPQIQLTSINDYTSPEQVVLEIGQLRNSNEKEDIKNKSLLKIEEQRKEMEEYLAEMNLK
ncbi:hypothetical protein RhiirC2_787442 [Rhizophagus irregularis]|uniref:FLYWCH-type domain-containing protein n=1 Tax=Rhizophagus irregularis TaxID=588596 RepID=A0A2N1MS57_9GLOM|nr:hypothetical protein RhiirC2_787442 [Rhizophagus irregularis]